MTQVSFTLNGEKRTVEAGDDERLLDTLRRRAGTTSVREGCGVGECGACTATVNGHTVSTCLMRTVRCDGSEITTADGLKPDHPVVRAFVSHDAMQCGYCIPGFVMMTDELLRENPHPTIQETKDHLEGNICRCGVYDEILEAIQEVSSNGQ